MEDCPRWYVIVRTPIASGDPRALLEIPAAFFVRPASSRTMEIIVEPGDTRIEAAFNCLAEASTHSGEDILELDLLGFALQLDPYMREELLSALAVLLIGTHCECPVMTQAMDPVH